MVFEMTLGKGLAVGDRGRRESKWTDWVLGWEGQKGLIIQI